jgi:hypothetical protein
MLQLGLKVKSKSTGGTPVPRFRIRSKARRSQDFPVLKDRAARTNEPLYEWPGQRSKAKSNARRAQQAAPLRPSNTRSKADGRMQCVPTRYTPAHIKCTAMRPHTGPFGPSAERPHGLKSKSRAKSRSGGGTPPLRDGIAGMIEELPDASL